MPNFARTEHKIQWDIPVVPNSFWDPVKSPVSCPELPGYDTTSANYDSTFDSSNINIAYDTRLDPIEEVPFIDGDTIYITSGTTDLPPTPTHGVNWYRSFYPPFTVAYILKEDEAAKLDAPMVEEVHADRKGYRHDATLVVAPYWDNEDHTVPEFIADGHKWCKVILNPDEEENICFPNGDYAILPKATAEHPEGYFVNLVIEGFYAIWSKVGDDRCEGDGITWCKGLWTIRSYVSDPYFGIQVNYFLPAGINKLSLDSFDITILPVGSTVNEQGTCWKKAPNNQWVAIPDDTGNYLRSLLDVDLSRSELKEGEVLMYDSFTGYWVNGNPSGIQKLDEATYRRPKTAHEIMQWIDLTTPTKKLRENNIYIAVDNTDFNPSYPESETNPRWLWRPISVDVINDSLIHLNNRASLGERELTNIELNEVTFLEQDGRLYNLEPTEDDPDYWYFVSLDHEFLKTINDAGEEVYDGFIRLGKKAYKVAKHNISVPGATTIIKGQVFSMDPENFYAVHMDYDIAQFNDKQILEYNAITKEWEMNDNIIVRLNDNPLDEDHYYREPKFRYELMQWCAPDNTDLAPFNLSQNDIYFATPDSTDPTGRRLVWHSLTAEDKDFIEQVTDLENTRIKPNAYTVGRKCFCLNATDKFPAPHYYEVSYNTALDKYEWVPSYDEVFKQFGPTTLEDPIYEGQLMQWSGPDTADLGMKHNEIYVGVYDVDGTTLMWVSLHDPINAVPVGTVIDWTHVSPIAPIPEGYLRCNGQSISRTAYADLFAVISTVYGADDDDHFNVPTLKGDIICYADRRPTTPFIPSVMKTPDGGHTIEFAVDPVTGMWGYRKDGADPVIPFKTYETGTDVSATTALASDVAYGKIFYLANGQQAIGTKPSEVPYTSVTATPDKVLYGYSYIGSDGARHYGTHVCNTVDPTDANATEPNVLTGKTFYSQTTEKRTGSMKDLRNKKVYATSVNKEVVGTEEYVLAHISNIENRGLYDQSTTLSITTGALGDANPDDVVETKTFSAEHHVATPGTLHDHRREEVVAETVTRFTDPADDVVKLKLKLDEDNAGVLDIDSRVIIGPSKFLGNTHSKYVLANTHFSSQDGIYKEGTMNDMRDQYVILVDYSKSVIEGKEETVARLPYDKEGYYDRTSEFIVKLDPEHLGDAEPWMVLEDHIFSSDYGTREPGMMPNNGSVEQELTRDVREYIIPEGYHDGTGRVFINSTIGAGNAQPEDVILGKTFSNEDGDFTGEMQHWESGDRVLIRNGSGTMEYEGQTVSYVKGHLSAEEIGKYTDGVDFYLITTPHYVRDTVIPPLVDLSTNTWLPTSVDFDYYGHLPRESFQVVNFGYHNDTFRSSVFDMQFFIDFEVVDHEIQPDEDWTIELMVASPITHYHYKEDRPDVNWRIITKTFTGVQKGTMFVDLMEEFGQQLPIRMLADDPWYGVEVRGLAYGTAADNAVATGRYVYPNTGSNPTFMTFEIYHAVPAED